MPIDAELLEILACPACKTPVRLVKDGTALKCDSLPPGLRHQGRHPGDAARRGDSRALKILLVRLRLVGDVVFTTPAIRALRRRYPAAVLDYVVEPAAAPVVRHNPHLTPVIEADRPRGLARLRYDLALARRLRAASYDVAIDFHGGPRSAVLVRASGAPAAHRLRHSRPALGVHHAGALASAPGAAAALGAQPMGPARRRSTSAPPTRPRRRRDGGRRRGGRRRRAAARRGRRRRRAPLVVLHVSASNPFRRWPRRRFADGRRHARRRRSRRAAL